MKKKPPTKVVHKAYFDKIIKDTYLCCMARKEVIIINFSYRWKDVTCKRCLAKKGKG